MSETIHPIVHLNGTSREELISIRLAALDALREAEIKLSEMAPNGRDYYFEDGLLEKALEQHRARVETLKTIREDIFAEVEKMEDE